MMPVRPGSGCGRAGAWDALHGRAAESAKADFALFQRRIHSLVVAGAALPDPMRDRAPSSPAHLIDRDGRSTTNLRAVLRTRDFVGRSDFRGWLPTLTRAFVILRGGAARNRLLQ
jgi:hypothetical protein